MRAASAIAHSVAWAFLILSVGVSTARAQALPNLAASQVRTASSAAAGGTLAVTFRLAATGADLSASYAVLLGVGDIEDGAMELGRFGPVALTDGVPQDLTVPVSLPAGVTGLRRVIVWADPGRVVSESNESDNLGFALGAVLIEERGPRPAVVSVSTPGGRVSPGDSVPVEVELADAAGLGTELQLWVVAGRDAVSTASDRQLSALRVTVPASGSSRQSLAVPIPASLEAGAWRLGVVLDPEGASSSLDPATAAGTAANAITVVRSELSLSTTHLPDGTVGQPYQQRLRASGGDGSYAFAFDPALPSGLGVTSGVVEGTPSSAGDSTHTLTVRSDGRSASASLTLRIQSTGRDLSILTSSLTPALYGRSYVDAFRATGGEPPYAWSVLEGGFPAGIVLEGSGALSGAPTEFEASEATVLVRDALGAERSARFRLEVQVAPDVLVRTASVAGPVGALLDVQLEAIGGVAPLSWTAETTLPPGLSFSSSGRLSGTPTQVGRWPFRVRVRDATAVMVSDPAYVAVDIVDDGALVITSGAFPEVRALSSAAHELTAMGGVPPYRWSLAPGDVLPNGFVLGEGPEQGYPETSGVIYGRGEAAAVVGFAVRVEDAQGRMAEQPLAYVAKDPLRVDTGSGCRDTGPSTRSLLGFLPLLGGIVMLVHRWRSRTRLRPRSRARRG